MYLPSLEDWGLYRYPEGDLDTNLTIVITNVGADFTRLGSFGDAEQFGGNVVAQMDRSYLNRSWNKPKSPVQVFTDMICGALGVMMPSAFRNPKPKQMLVWEYALAGVRMGTLNGLHGTLTIPWYSNNMAHVLCPSNCMPLLLSSSYTSGAKLAVSVIRLIRSKDVAAEYYACSMTMWYDSHLCLRLMPST